MKTEIRKFLDSCVEFNLDENDILKKYQKAVELLSKVYKEHYEEQEEQLVDEIRNLKHTKFAKDDSRVIKMLDKIRESEFKGYKEQIFYDYEVLYEPLSKFFTEQGFNCTIETKRHNMVEDTPSSYHKLLKISW